MLTKKYFGTDGIRGKVGVGPISPDWFLKLGWAVGRVLSTKSQPRVLIGKDTRISGYMFESALEAGLAAAGVDVHLIGPMPTPGIAYLTKTLQFDAGIVISASHNSYHDNGIKFFAEDGTKLSDELEFEIEKHMELPIITVASNFIGKAARIKDAQGRYIEFCKSTFPNHLNLKGLNIVVDCANGAAYNIAPNVFRELGAEVFTIGDKPNGLNINDSCGATNTKLLASKVIELNADLGIALDGDGDRIIMVDHTGAIVDGDEILAIIARWYLHNNKDIGGVAGTLMSNMGLEQSLAKMNISFCRTKVGDRYVLEALKNRGWLLGGEASGHIICLDLHSTGDGTIAALQVLAAILSFGTTLHEQKQIMHKFPQVLLNLPLDKKIDLKTESIKQAVADIEQKLQGSGRVLLRSSGTESVVRVMVEGTDIDLVKKSANELVETIKRVACVNI